MQICVILRPDRGAPKVDIVTYKDNALGGLCKTQKNNMNGFILRLKLEKSQLDVRIDRLEAFTKSDAFNGIDNVQRGLFKIQLNAMITYSQVLDELQKQFFNKQIFL